ncbi:MAG: hypothetical protein GY759_18220 [Chloroflexi bacterium]|nr:hypothetical protein [Chloroflexota bacterium]
MSESLQDIQAQVRLCIRCSGAGYPIQGPPIFSGTAAARLMIVGQAPGRAEVSETLRPFSGSAGARLFRWLKQAGFDQCDIREQHYISSITKCFPGANASGRGDRAPTRAEQRFCSEWLEAEVTLVDPEVILPVGKLAIERFFGKGFKLVDLIGNRFQVDGRIFIPFPHPSGASSWIQQSEHQKLIRQAINQLAQAKMEFDL